MARKKTTEEFKKEISNLYGNEYNILDDYKGNKEKIKFKHSKCNNIFMKTPNDFLGRTFMSLLCKDK